MTTARYAINVARVGVPELAQNTWIVIKGTNLVPANTPSAGVTWSDASSFASGKMPTDLRGVSVLVNGLPAYVYFFCSAVTDSACAKDQINVLTPLDTIAPAGPTASVVVTNNGVSSPAFIVDRTAQIQPSFLLFSARGDVVAVHLDGSLVGPVTLYPGASTPAKAGETVLLFPIGFGLPSTPVVNGSATQSGPLPGTVLCFVGTKLATVPGAIISPGLTQLNLVIPAGTPTGDNLIWCGYAIPDGPRSQTPAGNLIAVQ